MTDVVQIYTDGGCSPNPGEGAWACLLRYKGVEKTFSGYEPQTTNNRMELMAALMALRALKRPAMVELYTDSQYVKNGLESWIVGWQARGWRTADKKPVLNADLWQALLAEANKHQMSYTWVRGHSGHAENERVDELVRKTRLSRGKLESDLA
jgi:ribonuclease HI